MSSVLVAAAFSIATAGVAQATTSLPSQTADPTGMVEKVPTPSGNNTNAVRTITQVGNDFWIGGIFNQVDDTNGSKVATASGLVPFNASTGALDTSVNIPTLTASSGSPEVYGTSLDTNGYLYFAGNFTSVNGQTRHNVAAIDPTTGNVLPFNPSAGAAYSILATSDAIYVGTAKLLSFQLNGNPTPGYKAPTVSTVPCCTLRQHKTIPNFRSIAKVGNTLISACQCDSLTDANTNVTRNVKAIVETDATTGKWVDWAPKDLCGNPTNADSCDTMNSAAFGIQAIIHDGPSGNPVIYLAAGGSDFVTAYPFTSDSSGLANDLWHTDTSGSSQAITWYQGSLIVGGHFDWTASPNNPQCGGNKNPPPNTNCYFSPKLVAMSPTDGKVQLTGTSAPWNPGICCRYNGVWDVTVADDGSTLNVGGEFDKAGGNWTCKTYASSCLANSRKQINYARFSGSAATSETLSVATAGNGSGTVTDQSSTINCGLSCVADFSTGSTETLTATPDVSSTFTGWSSADPGINCPGTGTCTVAMSQARSVTATFTTTSSPPPGTTIDDSDLSVAYNGWQGVPDSSAGGGSFRESHVTSDRVTWKSPSTDSITWVAHAGPDQGIASIKIDGTSPQCITTVGAASFPTSGSVDLYSPLPGGASTTCSGLATQPHTVVVRPTGTQDGLASDAEVSVDAFQANGGPVVEESDNEVQYNDWTANTQSAAYGGSYRISSSNKSTVTVSFTGTAIDWITAIGKAYGQASVSIDGGPPSTVDLYSATQVWQKTFPFGGLPSGPHKMVIQVLPTNNASSTGYKVIVDGFIIHP